MAYKDAYFADDWWVGNIDGMITGKVKTKFSNENLSQWPFVHHKSYMDYPGTDVKLITERLSYDAA
jgi:hypothetical protein